ASGNWSRRRSGRAQEPARADHSSRLDMPISRIPSRCFLHHQQPYSRTAIDPDRLAQTEAPWSKPRKNPTAPFPGPTTSARGKDHPVIQTDRSQKSDAAFPGGAIFILVLSDSYLYF